MFNIAKTNPFSERLDPEKGPRRSEFCNLIKYGSDFGIVDQGLLEF